LIWNCNNNTHHNDASLTVKTNFCLRSWIWYFIFAWRLFFIII
jgi:hypothetical protein